MSVFAYFRDEQGPFGPGGKGVQLHYVCSNESLHPNVRKGNFYTPSIEWWPSLESFKEGKRGFSGITIEDVTKSHPNMIIMESKQDAIDAWKKQNEKEGA